MPRKILDYLFVTCHNPQKIRWGYIMKKKFIILLGMSLTLTLTAFSPIFANSDIEFRIQTLNRIVSENAVCLEGCRIADEHVLKMSGTVESLGRWIVDAMFDEFFKLAGDLKQDLEIFSEVYQTHYGDKVDLSGFYKKKIADVDRLLFSARQSRETLDSSGTLNINGFSNLVGELQNIIDESRNIQRRWRQVFGIKNRFQVEEIYERFNKFASNWHAYKTALLEGWGFRFYKPVKGRLEIKRFICGR